MVVLGFIFLALIALAVLSAVVLMLWSVGDIARYFRLRKM
jgi:hypothetical protein